VNAIPDRFTAVLDHGREAYLASPIGKARRAIASAHKSTRTVASALDRVSCALTRGDGSEAARQALFDAVLALRIAAADVDALLRLAEAA
jgi:hypothetical protein